jgi:hypothetical protein
MGRFKEDARRCERCDYKWWAVRAPKPKKVKWNHTIGPDAFGFDPAAITARKAHQAAAAVAPWERWAICRRCGSQTIKTVAPRGFVPTGLAEATQASAAEAGPSSTHGGSSVVDDFQPGARVVLRQLGYRGLEGEIVKRGLTGFIVKLDRGDTARGIPPDKLERI